MPKPSFLKDSSSAIKRDNWIQAFPKSISLKESVIVRLEFELVYYDLTVQNVNHKTRGIQKIIDKNFR